MEEKEQNHFTPEAKKFIFSKVHNQKFGIFHRHPDNFVENCESFYIALFPIPTENFIHFNQIDQKKTLQSHHELEKIMTGKGYKTNWDRIAAMVDHLVVRSRPLALGSINNSFLGHSQPQSSDEGQRHHRLWMLVPNEQVLILAINLFGGSRGPFLLLKMMKIVQKKFMQKRITQRFQFYLQQRLP